MLLFFFKSTESVRKKVLYPKFLILKKIENKNSKLLVCDSEETRIKTIVIIRPAGVDPDLGVRVC